jgi:ABC-2 type transport system ATP-binding protein
MISVINVTKKDKNKLVLNNVTLNFEGVYGLIGPNGAGKTTLMRAIAGLIPINEGTIELNDSREEIQDIGPAELKGKIGYLPQDFNLYPKATVFNCLEHIAALKGIKSKKQRMEKVEEVIKEVNLWKHKDKKIKELSGGMKKRVGIAQIFLNDPYILIIDEPTSGLDFYERIRFRNLLRNISKNKIVIISSHIVEDVEFLCTKIGIVQNGKVVMEGSPLDIASSASGKVWEVKAKVDELDKVFDMYEVIDVQHHVENTVIVRVLAEELINGSSVEPKLIDGYISLMRDQEDARNGEC